MTRLEAKLAPYLGRPDHERLRITTCPVPGCAVPANDGTGPIPTCPDRNHKKLANRTWWRLVRRFAQTGGRS